MCSQMLYSCCHFLGLEQSTSICLDCAISDHLLTSAKDILNMDDMSSLSLILFSLRLCVGLSHKIAILGGSNMKTRHSVRTVMAHCCVVFCTNDWRYKDEYRERTGEELHFHQFPVTVDKKWKSGSTVIDSKFAKLLCHTEPTLRNRLVLVVSVLYVPYVCTGIFLYCMYYKCKQCDFSVDIYSCSDCVLLLHCCQDCWPTCFTLLPLTWCLLISRWYFSVFQLHLSIFVSRCSSLSTRTCWMATQQLKPT